MPPKSPYFGGWQKPGQKPYNWKQAKNIDWFPGIDENTQPIDMGNLIPGGWNDGRGGTGAVAGGPGQNRGNAYKDLINRMLTQQRADFAGESVADAASRDAQIKRILVSYGEAPDVSTISGDARGVLQGILGDTGLQDLIRKNTEEGTSVKARMTQANEIANRQIGQGQAASGRLRSGDTGYRLGQQAMAQKQTAFDTLSQALGDIEGSVGNFASNERQRQRQLADAEMQAQMQAFQFGEDTDFGGGGGTNWSQSEYDRQTAQNNAAAAWLAQQAAQKAAAQRAQAEAQRRYQRMGPYGPYGPAVMPRSGMR